MKKKIIEEIRKRLEKDGYVTELVEVKKANYQGMALNVKMSQDSRVGITAFVEEVCSRILEENETIEGMVSGMEQALMEGPDIDLSVLEDYDKVKQNLCVQVLSTEKNREYLEKVPSRQLENLSVIVRINLGHDMSTAVTRDLMEHYQIEENILFADAFANAGNYPVNIISMEDIFPVEVLETMVPEDSVPEEAKLYICSFGSMMMDAFGAAVIAHPDFAKIALKKMGGPFFIIPSSIREVLLLKDQGEEGTAQNLAEMVYDVNRSNVSPKERLSDNVYYCDAAGNISTVA